MIVNNETVTAENVRQIFYTRAEQLEAGKKKACYQLLPQPIEGVTVEFVEVSSQGITRQVLAIKVYSDRKNCPVNAIARHNKEAEEYIYKAMDSTSLQSIRMQYKLFAVQAVTGVKFYWVRAA